MKKIDVRFTASDIAEIQSMAWKKLIKYKCDPCEFSTSVFGTVGIAFDNAAYAFTNLTEVMDYYGEKEDVALFKIECKPFSDIQSFVQNQTMIETPVECVISKITVVNERQSLFENGVQIYEVLLTRGIIFRFEDGHELSFEKNIWFSEDITVEKGYDLIARFAPTSEFTEGWSGNFHGECSRELITFE
jgi:hypothetical protein